jgi:hypothetical protein
MECPSVKKIRLVRPFRAYRSGAVLDLPGGQATELIRQGYAVEETQQQLLETAAAEPEIRTADATPKKRSRKK